MGAVETPNPDLPGGPVVEIRPLRREGVPDRRLAAEIDRHGVDRVGEGVGNELAVGLPHGPQLPPHRPVNPPSMHRER